MPAETKILSLGENHRRAISAALRNVERACDEVADWLSKESGVLQVVVEDMPVAQKERLAGLVEKLRGEIRRLDGQMTLDHARQSRRAAILALVSATIVDLEDSDSTRLAGYGSLREDEKARIDAALARLIAVADEMLKVVAQT